MADQEHASQTPAPKEPEAPKQSGAEPSGYQSSNPSTAGPGQTAVRSDTPENKLGHLNPSAPEDSNVTPGSTGSK
jgi:hypothetical protein